MPMPPAKTADQIMAAKLYATQTSKKLANTHAPAKHAKPKPSPARRK